MKLPLFYDFWKYFRGVSVIIAIFLLSVIAIRSHSWNLEIEYTGPGSEAERLSEATRDRDNAEARDRVNHGSRDPDDIRGSYEYSRDHDA